MTEVEYLRYFNLVKDKLEIKYGHSYVLFEENNRRKTDELYEYDIICTKCNTIFILDFTTIKNQFINKFEIDNIFYQYQLYDAGIGLTQDEKKLDLTCDELIIKGIIE